MVGSDRGAGRHRKPALAALITALIVLPSAQIIALSNGPRVSPPERLSIVAGRGAHGAALGQLTLRNTTSADVRVEVRSGPGALCDQLPAGAVRILAPGKRWVIAGRHAACWRRALAPELPVAAWTPWQRQILSSGLRAEATP